MLLLRTVYRFCDTMKKSFLVVIENFGIKKGKSNVVVLNYAIGEQR